jgi:LacI family repressor for deo operon, udp, cdd, tsx, nupC, and nupG
MSTVSRALREPGLLNQETLTKVTEAIQRLGYRPDLAAQHLRGGKTNLVIVIVPSLSPFFLDIIRGAEDAARDGDYGIVIGHAGRSLDREMHLLNEAIVGRADGVIIVTSVKLSALTPMLHDTPAVVALDICRDTGLPTVRVDHRAAAEAATRYLLELGHRRIAHITGPKSSLMSQHRLEGFRDAMAEHQAEVSPGSVVDGDYSMESGELAAMTLLTSPHSPTAIFAANDQMAIGAMAAADRLGLRVPEDVSVIGFDDERIAALYDPPLSTVRIPTYEIGRRSMVQLLRVMNDESVEQHIIYDTELAVRRSTTQPAG